MGNTFGPTQTTVATSQQHTLQQLKPRFRVLLTVEAATDGSAAAAAGQVR